jgi:hypothetical protein
MLTMLFVLFSMRVSVRESQPSGPELYTLLHQPECLLFSHAQSGRGRPAGGHEIAQRWAYGYPYRTLTVDTTRYGDWYAKLSLFWLTVNAALAGIVACLLAVPFTIARRYIAPKKPS